MSRDGGSGECRRNSCRPSSPRKLLTVPWDRVGQVDAVEDIGAAEAGDLRGSPARGSTEPGPDCLRPGHPNFAGCLA